MKLKCVFAAIAMTFASAAMAGAGCGHGHEKQAMSCADGFTWDAESQSCVSQTTS